MSKETQGVYFKEKDSFELKNFKNLLRRTPEKNYILGRHGGDYPYTQQLYEREDDVKLKWWTYDGKRTNNIETLKQERRLEHKTEDGKVTEVFPADSTAAQITMLIVEKGESPSEIEWTKKDIVVEGDCHYSNLNMNKSFKISYVFDSIKDEILRAAREINSDKYENYSLEEIGSDLIKLKEQKKREENNGLEKGRR